MITKAGLRKEIERCALRCCRFFVRKNKDAECAPLMWRNEKRDERAKMGFQKRNAFREAPENPNLRGGR